MSINFFLFKSLFVDNAQQCFAFTPQAAFPVCNLKFTEGDGIESRLPFKKVSTLDYLHTYITYRYVAKLSESYLDFYG